MFLKIISLTLEYEIRCPVPGEWRLTARRLNCGRDYVCLLRLPENIYYESCDGLDYSNRGKIFLTFVLFILFIIEIILNIFTHSFNIILHACPVDNIGFTL